MKTFSRKHGKKDRKAKGLHARLLKKFAKNSASGDNKKTSQPKDKDQQIEKIIKKRKLGKRIIKFLGYSAVAFILIFSASIITATFVLDQKTTTNLIKTIVEDQTGGKLDLKWKKYSFATGFIVDQFNLYLPKTKKSHTSGGEVFANPTVSFESLEIEYDLSSWIFLKAIVNKSIINTPQIYLDLSEENNSLSGMLDYREAKFGKSRDGEEEKSSEIVIPGWLPILISNIYSPFTVEANNVGFENLNIDLDGVDPKGNRINISGLSVSNEVFVSGFKNKFSSKIHSLNGVVISGLENLSVKLLPEINFSIENLKLLKLSLNNLLKVSSKHANPKINFTSEFTGGFNDDYLGFKIEQFKMGAEEFLKFEASGDFEWPSNSLKKINVKLVNSMKLNLEESLSEVLYELGGAKISGEINESCRISGTIDVSTKFPVLPLVDCLLDIANVSGSYKNLANLKELSGDARLLVRNGHVENSYVIEPEFDFQVLGISANVGQIEANINRSSSSLTSKINIVDGYVSPRTYLDFSVDSILVTKDSKLIFDESVEVGIQTRSNDTRKKYSLKSTAELGKFLKNDIELTCVFPCKKIDLGGDLSFKNFSHLNEIGKNAVDKSLAALLPSDIQGELNSSYKFSIDRPDNFDNDPFSLYRELNSLVGIKTKISIYNLSLLDPQLDLKNLIVENSVDLKGLDVAFANNVSIDRLEFKKDDKTVRVRQLTTGLLLDTNIPHGFDVEKISAKSNVQSKIQVVDYESDSTGLASVTKISSDLDLSVDGTNEFSMTMKDLSVDQMMKTNFILSASKSKSSPAFSADLDLETQMDYSFLSDYLLGAKSSGSSTTKLKASLDREDKLKLDVTQSFSNFSLDLSEYLKSIKINLGNMSGDFPIRLVSNISQIKKQIDSIGNEESKSFNDVLSDSIQGRKEIEVSSSDTERNLSSSGSMAGGKYDPIRISKIEVGGFKVEDISVRSSLESGGLYVDNAEFATMGGVGSAKLFVSLNPLPTRISGNLHLADVNTEEIPYRLKGRVVPNDVSSSLFSMTSHIDYMISDKVMNGEVKISKIGQEQAKYFLDLLDPKQTDQNINYARLGLKLGYPKGISIPIRDGQMDVVLDIRSLGLPLPIPDVVGFPVIGLIDNIKDEKGF